MRALLVGDILAAARVLVVRNPHEWDSTLHAFLDDAHAAHKFHKRLRKPHPTWGNGSLMARVNCEASEAELRTGDTRFLIALLAVVRAITVWQTRRKPRVSFLRSRAMLPS
jgi:serine O-acetyltransferase